MMKKFFFTAGLFGTLLSALNPLAAQPIDFCGDACCEEWNFCDGKFTVGADWLYWKVTENNLDFGADVQQTADQKSINAHVLRPDFKYENGYRLFLGYELPCDCWEVGVIYTNIPGRGKKSNISNVLGGQFVQILDDGLGILGANQTNLPMVSDIRTKWDVNLSWLDLDIARSLCLCECFKLRPHIGARIYWMDQKYRLDGTTLPTSNGMNGMNNGNNVIPAGPLFAQLKEKFNGFGIEGGFWGEWSVTCGLSVVGHVGGSILYSKFRNCTFIHVPGNNTTNFGVSDNFWTGTPTFDYFIGLRYADYLCETAVSVHLGWEHHILFDANQISRRGNLSASGLTLGATVSF